MTDPRLAASQLLLRDVLDLPFPSDLQAAPRGDLVAWVSNEFGCRNVWLASASDSNLMAARRLTDYVGDDGRMLGQLRWNAAGDVLTYVRGTLLADGVPPNPASVPAGIESAEVWRVAIDGSAPRRLGAGHSPEVSPASGDVAWIRDGHIWLAESAGQRDPVRLVRDRGQCGAMSWSPDGSRLVFVSDRGGHSLVGVHDLAAQPIRWISPSVDRDIAPAWSPDGRRLAFVRLAENPAPTWRSRPSGAPWSIWIADADTGEAHCAWTAGAGAGSVFTPFAFGPSLLWAASGELVFAWEGSGWLHAHALRAGSPEAVDLTPGEFEVAGIAAGVGDNTVLVAANKDHIDGCRLWRVDLASRRLDALTSRRAVVGAAAVTGNGTVVTLQADARMPLQPTRIEAAGAARAIA
jgi:dipeptidyl aminopeptidase/acylaminoacyl peptidase